MFDLLGLPQPVDDLLGRMLGDAAARWTDGARLLSKRSSSRTAHENTLEVLSYGLSFGAFYLFVCYAKRTMGQPGFSRQGGWLSRLVYRCVGEETDSKLISADRRDTEAAGEQESFTMSAARLAACVLGIQVSYLLWGLMQERIMTKPYETGELFRSSKFLVFANRFLALAIAW